MNQIEIFAIRRSNDDTPEASYFLEEILGSPKDSANYWECTKILAQYACDVGYLVFYDDQAPFENGPEWLLFNKQMKLVDTGALAVPYQSDDATHFNIESANAITFNVFSRQFRVKVLSRPRWRFTSFFNISMFLPTVRKRWLVLETLEKTA